MGYKNSGGMKFNDATDLIIRADEDGTVESCFNRADSIEYINEYSVPVNVSIKINNSLAQSLPIYAVYWDDGVLIRRRVIATAGGYATTVVAKGSKNTLGLGTTIVVDDGEITIDGLTFTAETDGEITVS